MSGDEQKGAPSSAASSHPSPRESEGPVAPPLLGSIGGYALKPKERSVITSALLTGGAATLFLTGSGYAATSWFARRHMKVRVGRLFRVWGTLLGLVAGAAFTSTRLLDSIAQLENSELGDELRYKMREYGQEAPKVVVEDKETPEDAFYDKPDQHMGRTPPRQ